MKQITLIIFFCFAMVSAAYCQAPAAIEADLSKSYRKINYWDDRLNDTTLNASDSLDKANLVFGQQLKTATAKYPATIRMPFNLLKEENMFISTSADSLFRIYSWDTGGGGTEHEYASVFQYKANDKMYSIYCGESVNSKKFEYGYYYSKVYTLKAGRKTYYLGVYKGVYCTSCRGEGLQVFAIENGKLSTDVKIIQTSTGLHSQLYYEYDWFSVFHHRSRGDIQFNPKTKSIRLPLVAEKDRVTRKFITYKFNGKYFIKVKG
jgi:hypothetical protein